MEVVDKLGCGILLAINLLEAASDARRNSAVFVGFGGTPLPPHLSKAWLGAGFAKSVCKILVAKSLEVKI
jgi:hypothetical protein